MNHCTKRGGEYTVFRSSGARILLALGLLAAFSSAAPAQTTCPASSSINADRWSIVGLSCENTPSNSVADVFGNDFPVEAYGQDWVLYGHDPAQDSYAPLTTDSPLLAGRGYWLFSLQDGSFNPGGNPHALVSKQDSPECASDAGCFEIDLSEPGNGQSERWNLLSHPLNQSTEWKDVCLSDGTSSYSPSQADVARLMSKNIHKYNGNAYETYDDVTLGLTGVLNPNEGFWIQLLENAVGANLKLLVPAGAATDPCGNLPPALEAIDDQEAETETLFSLQASASDPDPNDTLTFSLPVKPNGMDINDMTGLIQWTPTIQQSGEHDVTVQVSDPAGLSDQEAFQVLVELKNNPPDLVPPGDRSIRQGIPFSSPLFAVDPDIGDSLTFSLPQAPTNLEVNPLTGLMEWTPGSGDLGPAPGHRDGRGRRRRPRHRIFHHHGHRRPAGAR